MWRASYLLKKLDDYHSGRFSELNIKSGPSLLNEITEEVESVLSGRGEMSKMVCVISMVKLDVGSYSADVPLLGEAKSQFIDVEEPHVFWKNILGNKSPRWKHITRQSPRNRKRVLYLEGSLADTENDDSVKKHRGALIEDVHQAAAPVDVQEHQAARVAGSREGPSRIVASSSSQSPPKIRDDMSGQSSTQNPEVDKCGDEEINESSDKHKSLRDSLQEETERLCRALKLSDDVNQTLRRFLDYVISNHPICRDSSAVMQAFQMSLLWVAASISKQEVDKTESLNLAKQHLNYQCTEEQVQSVYSQMLVLRRMYLRCCSPTIVDCCSLEENNTENVTVNSSSVNLKNAKTKTGESPANEGDSNVINEIQKKCDKRMNKLVQKQKREIEEIYLIREAEKQKLETDHKLASALIRFLYVEGSSRTTQLKLLDNKFEEEMEQYYFLKDSQLKDVEAKQLDARKKEREKVDQWMAEAKACCASQPAEVDGSASIKTSNDLIIINQPEFTGEIVCVDPPVTGETDPDETGLVEVHSTSEQAEASLQVPEDQVHRNLSSELQNQGVQAVEEDQNNIQIEVAVSETVGRATISKSNSKLADKDAPALDVETAVSATISKSNSKLPDQDAPALDVETVGSETISKSNSKLPDQDAPALEEETVGSATISKSNSKLPEQDAPALDVETVGSATISKSNSKLPDQDAPTLNVEDHSILQKEDTNSSSDGTVTPLQSNVDAHVSIDPSPSKDQSTAVEVEGQGHDSPRNSSQTTEAVETEILMGDQNTSPDSVTIQRSNSELSDREAPTPAPAVEDHGTLLIENSTVNPLQSIVDTQNIVSPSKNQSTAIEVENQSLHLVRNLEIEMLPCESASRTGVNPEVQNNDVMSPNQTFLQLGTDLGDPVTWDSPMLFAKPFQIELENIHRKNEQLDKIHEGMRLQLKSDCEKEIHEIAAQVLKKYELKYQEAEADYVSKKNGLDEYRKKVFTNKLLAKAFSFICEDLQPSGLPGIKQDFPSSSMRQQSPQQSVGPLPVSMNSFQAYRPAHVNNHHSSLEIQHALLPPQFQAFRPAAPSFISQPNLQQRMLEWSATTNQIRPQHQGGPPSPWAPFLNSVDCRSQVPGEPYFSGLN